VGSLDEFALFAEHDKALNKYIAKELNKLGWKGTSEGKKYWRVIKLKI
jgi:hypothetical protein